MRLPVLSGNWRDLGWWVTRLYSVEDFLQAGSSQLNVGMGKRVMNERRQHGRVDLRGLGVGALLLLSGTLSRRTQKEMKTVEGGRVGLSLLRSGVRLV